jgi:transposase
VARPISDINLETTTLAAVEASMRCTPTREGFLRLQGISFFYKGCSKQEVSRLLGVTVRAVQKWVKDFNEAGIDGVIGSRRTGRKRKIEPEVFSLKYREEFLSSAKTAISFYGRLINEHREDISYSTLLNYLHEQGLSRTVGRPTCVQRDPERREQFITKLNALIKEGADIWFGDEVGFDGDPSLEKNGFKKGKSMLTHSISCT